MKSRFKKGDSVQLKGHAKGKEVWSVDSFTVTDIIFDSIESPTLMVVNDRDSSTRAIPESDVRIFPKQHDVSKARNLAPKTSEDALLLSQMWAGEISDPTSLSKGMNFTEIQEKEAKYYRMYEKLKEQEKNQVKPKENEMATAKKTTTAKKKATTTSRKRTAPKKAAPKKAAPKKAASSRKGRMSTQQKLSSSSKSTVLMGVAEALGKVARHPHGATSKEAKAISNKVAAIKEGISGADSSTVDKFLKQLSASNYKLWNGIADKFEDSSRKATLNAAEKSFFDSLKGEFKGSSVKKSVPRKFNF